MFLEVKDVSVQLGEFYLDHSNLKLKKNDYMVIIGPTGSGKSVLLETIAGFHKPEQGHIYLEGEEITHLNPENRDISIVYQDYVLFPHMNVFENVAYGLKKKVDDKDFIESKVLKMAELLKIDHLLERNPETLSGGEKQRTAIARSLVVEPKILLMDEPFSALDVKTHSYLTTLLKNVIETCKTTCLHVTHNFTDVYSLAEQVAVMKEGKILQQGPVQEVFSNPKHNFVADFVGVHNVFEGTVKEIKEGLTTVKLKNDVLIRSTSPISQGYGNVFVALRPENIVISNEPFVSSLRNQLEGVVEDFILDGPVVWVKVNVKDVFFNCMVTLSSYDLLEIKKGKKVYISFKSVNVRIIEGYEF